MTNQTKERGALHELATLNRKARARYTYFITGNPDDGYRWSLVWRATIRMRLAAGVG